MSLIDNLELRALVTSALDEAIKTVAEQEFSRLYEITSDRHQVAENVRAALDSLVDLQKGIEPEYNKWDALFYLTWYQPYQINLALTILREVYEHAEQHPGPDLPLHIIDIGCGALAVQIAMAILGTEHQQKGNKIIVNGIDPSDPMKSIGELLWLEFWSILSEYPELSDLSHTCDWMTSNCELFDQHTSYCCDYSRDDPHTECWIVAIHAVYKTNMDEIKGALQTLCGQYSPSATLVTQHESNSGVARFVAGEYAQFRKLNSDDLTLQGELHETTQWRRRLVRKLPENTRNSIGGLLYNRPVEWAPDKTAAVLSEY